MRLKEDIKEDIYNYARQLDTLINRIKVAAIDVESKSAILQFYQDYLVQGYSQARKIKYLNTLKTIRVQLGQSFENITRQDITEWLHRLENTRYSEWTKRDYKIVLKIFFRWLKKSETYPSEVAWIRTTRARNRMLPEQLLTYDEVKRIAEAALHPRDKALVLVLYESGCRIGEILSLKIGNVEFDQYGAVLLVSGKTGHRRVRIIVSASNLALWLNSHPLRSDLNAPLWVKLGAERGHALSYAGAKTVLKEIAKVAGIKKRIYPHLFRHSRATHLANHLTEAQLKQLFGWVQGSDIASTYVHLSGRDIDKALLKLNGIAVEEDHKDDNFRLMICPRCKQQNSPGVNFCNFCGSAFDLSSVMKIDQAQDKANQLREILVKQPETLDYVLDTLQSRNAAK